MDLCFSRSLHQLIMEPTRTIQPCETLIDHIFKNASKKVIQSGVTEMRFSDHELIQWSRESSLLKLNEHYQISFRSEENYSHEIFVEKLRSTEFPDYSNQACVNDADQGFVSKFLHVVDSVAPIKTRRVKAQV